MLMSFTLFSCRDEIRLRGNDAEVSPGWLQLNMSVDAPEIIKTRGNENSVNSIDILFYENGELIKNYHTNTISISEKGIVSARFPMYSEIENLSEDTDVIVIANKEIIDDLNLDELESLTYDEINPESIVMSWRGYKADITDNKLGSPESPISLVRSVSKIKILNSSSDFRLTGFELYNAASKGYVLAAQLENDNIIASTETPDISESPESSVYCFPTQAGHAYLLIKGEYQGESSWYKIGIKSEGKDLDLMPNHLYDVQILSVKGHGHSSSENSDFWSFNDEEVEYKILDQTGGVLSMVSDGYRELGTTRELTIEGSRKNLTGNVFEVRLACIEEISENSGTNVECIHYPNLTNISITSRSHKEDENYSVEIVEGSGWFELDKVEIVEDESSSLSDNGVSISGKTLKYSLKLSSIVSGGELKALIKVCWQGLTREIPVFYKSDFSLSKIVNYDVMVLHDEDNVHEIESYINLLEGKKSSYHRKINGVEENDVKVVSLTGLRKEDMEGKIRDEGFHFPLMYGNPGNPYWAEHQLSLFSQLNSIEDYNYFKVDVKSDKPEVWSEDKLIISTGFQYKTENRFSSWIEREEKVVRGERQKMISEGSLLLDLKRANYSNGSFTGIKDDYEYSTAQLIVTLYKDENDYEGVDFSITLYHTGFFHFVEDKNTQTQGTFYYYEVIPMGNDNQGKQIYWLDRNMGSTHALDYVDFGNGTTLGEKGGLYYSVVKKNNEGNIEISDEQICPPGYHVPNVTEWNYMMQDPNFVNDPMVWNANTYFTTYYQSPVGNIYFPKGRYARPRDMNPDVPDLTYPEATAGDVATGYYWTRSITEAGKLQAYKFYDGKASLFDGDIENDWMYLRCVAGVTPSEESMSSINFNVKGATHVFLYTLGNQADKQGLFAYPGKEIARAREVRNLDFSNPENIENDDNCIKFSYLSVIPESELYVLFVYKDENGKVILLSSNKADTLGGAEGWRVKNGGKYYFYWDKNFGEYTAIVPE